jgi:hypothetical protein
MSYIFFFVYLLYSIQFLQKFEFLIANTDRFTLVFKIGKSQGKLGFQMAEDSDSD